MDDNSYQGDAAVAAPSQREEVLPPEQENQKEIARNKVKSVLKQIKDAKKYFEDDYKRMRKNMEFAASIQRKTQKTMDTEEYMANWINKQVNDKVASLYAKDPKAVYRRRKRLDYKLWDGDPKVKVSAMASVQQAGMLGMMPSPEAMMLLMDIEQGDKWKEMVDRVGETLETLYEIECDQQDPSFKYQMKQLVRRVVTTGVGYVRLNFVREGEGAINADATDDSLSMRVKRAQLILSKLEDKDLQSDDAQLMELQMLVQGLQASVQQGAQTEVQEKIEFDFPSSTSIIVDPRCRSLKGFVGARWIAQQYIVPLDFINAYFELDIKPGGDLVEYAEDGIEQSKSNAGPDRTSPDYKPLCCLFEVFDLDTKTCYYVADGYKEFVQEPYENNAVVSRFWPIFTLTFNDIETEPGMKVHVYPPSDVDLLTHPQKEWNRTRQGLREHRQENAPFYVTRSGWLTEDDKRKLSNHQSGEVIELQGAPPDGDISKSLVAFKPAPIDAAVYDTTPYVQDAARVVGTQQQDVPMNNVAATPAVIQEQSRASGVNSNVDDLDDLLSELARAAGEIMLREFSPQTVERLVGRGMVWPEQDRTDFMNEIYLDVVAASSGRPNKAVDIANFAQIAPLLIQNGANPWSVIQEGVTRLDDRLDVGRFAPITPPNPTPGAKPTGQGSTAQPGAGKTPQRPPMQQNMGQQPMALPPSANVQ